MSIYTDYLEFYDITKYGNENWKCHLSEREIAEVAHELWFDHYLYNIDLENECHPNISENLIQLYRNLIEDVKNNNIRTLELVSFLEMSVPGIDNYRN